MANAALTFVYNESVNLPIWVNYYGNLFGHENLFVIDRSSTDGSTTGLGDVNVIRIPRNAFDEDAKTNLLSSFQSGLTSIYNAVVVTDCDEILVPDPLHHRDLVQYIEGMKSDYVNAIGIDVVHMINEEAPLNLGKSILSQRAVGRFHAPECKHLLSRIPIKWLPGLHSSNKPPIFDTGLFIFHLKLMDYGMAMGRQLINLSTEWSKESLEVGYGAHHRYTLNQFVQQHFFVPIDMKNRGLVKEFEFSVEVAELMQGTVTDPQGNYRVPMNIAKLVKIPERFASIL